MPGRPGGDRPRVAGQDRVVRGQLVEHADEVLRRDRVAVGVSSAAIFSPPVGHLLLVLLRNDRRVALQLRQQRLQRRFASPISGTSVGIRLPTRVGSISIWTTFPCPPPADASCTGSLSRPSTTCRCRPRGPRSARCRAGRCPPVVYGESSATHHLARQRLDDRRAQRVGDLLEQSSRRRGTDAGQDRDLARRRSARRRPLRGPRRAAGPAAGSIAGAVARRAGRRDARPWVLAGVGDLNVVGDVMCATPRRAYAVRIATSTSAGAGPGCDHLVVLGHVGEQLVEVTSCW